MYERIKMGTKAESRRKININNIIEKSVGSSMKSTFTSALGLIKPNEKNWISFYGRWITKPETRCLTENSEFLRVWIASQRLIYSHYTFPISHGFYRVYILFSPFFHLFHSNFNQLPTLVYNQLRSSRGNKHPSSFSPDYSPKVI